MLAELGGVVAVLVLGAGALFALAFVQVAMGARPRTPPVPPSATEPDPRRRLPLPQARVFLLVLLLSPALVYLVGFGLALRELGASGLLALAVFALPLGVGTLAFMSSRGPE